VRQVGHLLKLSGEEYILHITLLSNNLTLSPSLNVRRINSDPKYETFISALAGYSKKHHTTKQR